MAEKRPGRASGRNRFAGGSSAGSRRLPLAARRRPPGEFGPDRWTVPGVCVFLAAIIWVVFGQTVHFQFVNLDDNLYVYDNPEVAGGLRLQGIVWAFTHFHATNWHPLTWLSHMLDCQLYGLNPGGHHLTNVLLHTTAVILLFLVLRRMTGFLWRSAFVAALFAIHPLRAESVAWVAERKDVLSGVFFMLTLWAYGRYAQRRSEVESSSLHFAAPGWRESRVRAGLGRAYALVLLLFALGLMCKPMLVTLPLVLLLLDYWPLNRFAAVTGRDHAFAIWRRLILEKLPLLGLAAASCMVTLFAQAVTIQPFRNISLALRVGNALISYVAYLREMFWPSGLAAFYPFAAGEVRISKAVLSLAVLAGISTGVFVLRRRRPYLLTGWLWYLIMLAPVIGIVQVGGQARADRYSYLPQIGLYVLLSWAVAELCAGWRHRRVALGVGCTIILTALTICARTQVSYWRNNEVLWTHALACTTGNWFAHNNLGAAVCQKGNVNEGIAQLQMALQINPDFAAAHNNLGTALYQKGNMDEAIVQFQKALRINPDIAQVRYNLGNALFRRGDVDEAIVQFQKALQIDPDNAEAHDHLGFALFQKGRVDEAIVQYQETLEINPDNAQVHDNLGNALFKRGDVDEAIAQYQKALQIDPDNAEAHDHLGFALFQKGRVDEAIVQYQETLEINPDFVQVHDNLGNALFKRGDVDEAIAQFQNALQINPHIAQVHDHLGSALLKRGDVAEAIAQYQKALQINPRYVETLNNLAWVLATCPRASLRNGHQAVELAQRANQLAGDGHLALLGTLAAAYAEAGRFPEAVSTAQRALQVAQTQTNTARADALRSQLKLYQAGSPFRDTEQKP